MSIIGDLEGESQHIGGSSFVLENVRYIPELKRNLISLGTLDREGYTVKLQNGRVKECWYTRKGNVLPQAYVAINGLGHISKAGLHETGKKRDGAGKKSGLPDSFWAKATVTAAYPINRSPSTALEKKTPVGVRSGYRLWRLDDVKPKIIISRDVVFNESLMYKDTLRVLGLQDFGKEVEFEVELQGSRIEPTVDPHTGENLGNEDEEQDEGLQQQNLDNYVLVRDRAKRTTTIPERYRDERSMYIVRPSGSRVILSLTVGMIRVGTIDVKTAFLHAMGLAAAAMIVVFTSRSLHQGLLRKEFDMKELGPARKILVKKYYNSRELKKRTDAKDDGDGLYVKGRSDHRGVQKPRYKARLVARGFTQRAGIDYNEVYSHVVRHTSIRVLLSLTACEDYELEQLDVKTAFLHGNLEETIYMRQPPGFEEGTSNKVCLLKKSLYGLKQSPRQWYKQFDVYMISNRFSRSNYDSCVYFKEFAPARKILGMEIVRDRGSRTLKVSQSGYVQKSLNNYIVDNGKSVSVPLGAHFKFNVLDGVHKTGYCGSADVGLVYGRDQGKHVDVDGFMDADYAKDLDKGRSITGYVFTVHGCVLSWKATLKHVVALSTTEAEYMALTEAVKKSIWLKGLLFDSFGHSGYEKEPMSAKVWFISFNIKNGGVSANTKGWKRLVENRQTDENNLRAVAGTPQHNGLAESRNLNRTLSKHFSIGERETLWDFIGLKIEDMALDPVCIAETRIHMESIAFPEH
ncbi:retrotransposon protein, putative, ty1-copia subclass [Tanacetum coccineum]|uniref:Retrotransposon protein, putative, ty1-copia subclass n=1 Tax=Tanacetum coccineum TaxID=301880 RepID=A0ABQ4Z0G1_9ASTR